MTAQRWAIVQPRMHWTLAGVAPGGRLVHTLPCDAAALQVVDLA